MVTQFSLNMLVPIAMMCVLGVRLDKTFETAFWTVLLFFVGAIAGGQNIYRMAKRFWGDSSQNKEQKVSGDDIGKIKK